MKVRLSSADGSYVVSFTHDGFLSDHDVKARLDVTDDELAIIERVRKYRTGTDDVRFNDGAEVVDWLVDGTLP